MPIASREQLGQTMMVTGKLPRSTSSSSLGGSLQRVEVLKKLVEGEKRRRRNVEKRVLKLERTLQTLTLSSIKSPTASSVRMQVVCRVSARRVRRWRRHRAKSSSVPLPITPLGPSLLSLQLSSVSLVGFWCKTLRKIGFRSRHWRTLARWCLFSPYR